MSGFIIFGDGRAWTSSNAGFDEVIEQIAAALPSSPEGRALAEWSLGQRSFLLGPGMGRVDFRELTPANQQLMLDAMSATFPAVPLAELRPRSPLIMLSEPTDWFVVDRLQLLGHMVAAVRRGEPPELLNPLMRGLSPPTNQHSGPGWPDHERADISR